MSDSSPSLSVIIPVYNSETILPLLLEKLNSKLTEITSKYEILIIDDASRDNSWDVLKKEMPKYPRIHAFRLMRNYGQHNAILCGIRNANHEIILTMDDDLQHPPEEIPKLLDVLEQGMDVVYGTPKRDKHNLWRNLASRMTKLVLQRTMGADTAGKISAFRAFRTKVRDGFINYHGSFLSIDVLLTWGTTRFASVPVEHRPRYEGKSNYTFHKLMTHAFNMVTGFSAMPLKIASWIGFLCTAFGLCIFGYVTIRYFLMGQHVPGFTFLASIIAIFSGAQLFSLGIFGEYLARIHFGMLEQPAYSVREELNPAPTEKSE